MYKLIRPLIFKYDPEDVHEKIIALSLSLSNSHLNKIIKGLYSYENKMLNTNVFGIDFKNPVGLAAGYDKNGELLDFLPSLGFGFIEIGSVSAQPSQGNTKPRIFRFPKDKSLVNRTGLPNKGVDKIHDKIKDKKFKVPVGINIVKTHNPELLGEAGIFDICYSFLRLHDLGDYITINISCPNTAEGKTFEDKNSLNDLLLEINKIRKNFSERKPILLKISPDLSYNVMDDVLEIAEYFSIDGYVISNTSSINTKGIEGGLSGLPIKQKSTELIRYVHKHIPDTSIVGVGGIFSAQDAYEKILAGASLVQGYTGLIYEGPGLVKKINKGLVRLLKRDGFSSLEEAVGSE
ncbi:MAG: quinone-dependent dihydroorotate dehydrogenase [Nanoarchaeota archaeon]|nr:quinone-dependent dihydroorotate dehydrogenase [Nanoarchaeota archaeon]MBU1322114.1 quinone-dependent dihydroorotate dehydrogenase [Nanoarchaeota archaeon]MBU1597435.1 quinone-dependent dihydroorotate dehydrogenase [Nanoarchaeota archaeon]MBU2441604.1 quinone-dependent dihydroorotate dehydrogenase [Nanoarchaeota archaeon]